MPVKPRFAEIAGTLDGVKGLIYLLFLGRETYLSSFKNEFVSARLYAFKETVDQRFEDLKGTNRKYNDFFLESKGRAKSRGAPKVYQAKLGPILETLTKLEIPVDDEWLASLLSELSFLNNKFPQYFADAYTLGDPSEISTRKISWLTTLSVYFTFLSFRLLVSQKPTRKTTIENPFLELALLLIPSETISLEHQKRLEKIPEQNPDAWLKLMKIAVLLTAKNLEGTYATVVSSLLTFLFSLFSSKELREYNPVETKLYYKQGELIIYPTFNWPKLIVQWLGSLLEQGESSFAIPIHIVRCDAYKNEMCYHSSKPEPCKYNKPGKAFDCPILRKRAKELIPKLKQQS